MKIIAYPNPSAAGVWRLVDPFKYLRRRGVEARISPGPITDQELDWADIIVLHGIVDRIGIAAVRAYQAERGKKVVVEQDDYWQLEGGNPFKADHELTAAPEVIAATMRFADMVTTTNQYLAHRLKALNPNVSILPNLLDLQRWDLNKQPNTSDRIRIGWAGSITHLDDLALVAGPLQQIKNDYPQVDLVFVGDLRIKQLFGTTPIEVMPGVPFEVWPARLHGLRLDIAIAPLRDTPFNRCKSNIKFLEYAIAQIPGVYSPTVYQLGRFEPDFGLIAHTPEQWYACLRNLVVSSTLREDIRRHAYSFVKGKFNLEKQITLWERAYQSLLDLT